MHSTIVKEDGSYPRKLNVGDVQQMSFTEDDIGPFYYSDYEQQPRRFDCLTGQQKTLFKIKKMIEFYCKDEGWLYKPKGSLQILYERGFIDERNLSKYSNKGKTNQLDGQGNVKAEHKNTF
jgi:hypothetical protein